MAEFLDIRTYVSHELEYVKSDIKRFNGSLYYPEYPIRLVVIQIGDDPASNSYIRGKQKDCENVGIVFDWVKLDPDDTGTFDVVNIIEKKADIRGCCGIMVQLPIPDKYDLDIIRDAIPDELDVDGFKQTSQFTPCTPKGIIDYLDYCDYPLEGTNALVIGRSDIVGKPLARLLLEKDATVTVAHSKTRPDSLSFYIAESDIVFSAINKIQFFDERFGFDFYDTPPDVIDITLGRGDDGKLHGSLTDEAIEHIRWNGSYVISGTGGVGLLTRLALMKNVCKAAGPY